jgi:hypothetical protein
VRQVAWQFITREISRREQTSASVCELGTTTAYAIANGMLWNGGR